MKSTVRRFAADSGICFLLVLLALFLLLPAGRAESEAPQYIENAWNYVDGSMDVSGGIPSDATGRLGRIRNVGKLTVATSPDYPPQEFIDDTREGQARYVGADMELARRIAERMGVELEIVPMEFAEVLSTVAEGKYDLAISALSFTSGRAAILEMSKGYYYSGEPATSGVLIREESTRPVFHVAYNQSMTEVAPTTSLVCSRINWEPYVIGAVEAVMARKRIEAVVPGRVHGADMSAGFENGWVEVLELNQQIAAEGTQEAMDAAIARFRRKKETTTSCSGESMWA